MSTPDPELAGKSVAGKLSGVYGVKGWVKVQSYTDPAENIFSYQPWFLADLQGNLTGQTLEIDAWRNHGKGLIAHIKGVDDRDQAALLCQRKIAVAMGALPELPAGEYYWQQLKGLRVLSNYHGGDNPPRLLGQVKDLMETGANDVMIVGPCDGSIDQRERLLPYVDAHVLEVDLQAGTMLVDWDPDF